MNGQQQSDQDPATNRNEFHKARIDLAIVAARAMLRKIATNSQHWMSDSNYNRLDNIDAELTAFVDEQLQEYAEATDSRRPWKRWKRRTPQVLSLQAKLVHHVNKTIQGLQTPVTAIDAMKTIIDGYANPAQRG